MKKVAKVLLKKGREKPTLARHPWIFSGTIEQVDDYQFAGQICDVYSHDGKFLARGYINKKSWIACRLLVWDEQKTIDFAFLKELILKAKKLRDEIIPPATTAYRLINSEGDFLPGLVVDFYGDGIVCQFLTAGADSWREELVKILVGIFKPRFIFENSQSSQRIVEEGLEKRVGVLWGKLENPEIEIVEQGAKFAVDIAGGHKTGFYLDQRVNRSLIRSLAKNKKILDCYAYTGGFGLNAALWGAKEVAFVESSAKNIELIKKNFEINGLDSFPYRALRADVKDYLKSSDETFDLIVLDPPKFARHEGEVEHAKKGYWDINKLAIERLKSGGLLMTFSCSQLVSWIAFQEIIFTAAMKAKRNVRIIKRLCAAPDHPVSVYHPEGEYLKGFLVWVS